MLSIFCYSQGSTLLAPLHRQRVPHPWKELKDQGSFFLGVLTWLRACPCGFYLRSMIIQHFRQKGSCRSFVQLLAQSTVGFKLGWGCSELVKTAVACCGLDDSVCPGNKKTGYGGLCGLYSGVRVVEQWLFCGRICVKGWDSLSIDTVIPALNSLCEVGITMASSAGIWLPP